MKVFIFGAGASSGSQELYSPSVKAPLVNNLFDLNFDGAYAQYADAVGLSRADIDHYQRSFQVVGNLETWLTQLWEEHNSLKTQHARNRNRARFGRITFYIWLMMQNVSNTYNDNNGYRLLLNKLMDNDDECAYINFNYDTLFDRALMENGTNLISESDYLDNNYIKPHGSVNWFLRKRTSDSDISINDGNDIMSVLRLAENAMYRDEKLSFGLNVIEPGHGEISTTQIFRSDRFGYQYVYPFILIPLSTKLYGHYDGYKESVVDNAKLICDKADEIYLIGYRASDELIKDIFAGVKTGTILHVVSKGDADDVLNSVLKWKPELKKGTVHNTGFVDFINQY